MAAQTTTKLQACAQLAADNAAAIVGSFENWSAYLATAARLYKLTFLEQLCVHVQRPGATACADYSTWHDTMRRYIRRYAKSIPVIRIVDGQPVLRYLFDVADTGPREGALYPFLWENKDKYRSVITAALESRFEVPCDDRGLAVQLATIAVRLAQKFWDDNHEQIVESAGGWPPDCTGETFVDAVAASVAYAVLSRCALHPEQMFVASDFANVHKFDSFLMVLALGTAVSRCNENVLRCIESAIKQYERDKQAAKPAPEAAA